jgi:hypothetical protein
MQVLFEVPAVNAKKKKKCQPVCATSLINPLVPELNEMQKTRTETMHLIFMHRVKKKSYILHFSFKFNEKKYKLYRKSPTYT